MVSKDSVRKGFMTRMYGLYAMRKPKKNRGIAIERHTTLEFQDIMYQTKFPIQNWAPSMFFHPTTKHPAQRGFNATFERKPFKMINSWQVRRTISEMQE